MSLMGEGANGFRTKHEDTLFKFVDEDEVAAISGLVGWARKAAGWPVAVTRGLARVVHGLCVARKSKRQSLEAMEVLLYTHSGAAASEAQEKPRPALLEEEEEDAVGEGMAGGRSSGRLMQLVGQLEWLAVKSGRDAVLARLRKHINAAFLSFMMPLKAKYA